MPPAQSCIRPQYAPVRALETEAEEKLVSANLRLARSYALKYAWGRWGRCRTRAYIDQVADELYSAGVVGLIIAAQRYDPTRASPLTGQPAAFGTYAAWWVRQQICEALPEIEMRLGPKRHYWKYGVLGKSFADNERTYNASTGAMNSGNVQVVSLDDDPADEADAAISAELWTLLNLALDERRARLVRRRVIDEATYKVLAQEERVSDKRCQQLVETALATLRECRPFMAVLDKIRLRYEQRRQFEYDTFTVRKLA